MSKSALRRWKRIFRNHEITIVVREFQENEDNFTGDSGEDLLTMVEEKGKKGSDFSSKQVKVKEEPARPSTPLASGSATQTQKRPLSLSSPQPLPRPKAPVPPETPPRQGICGNAIELSEPMSDNVGEEEEEEKEEEKDQAPPAQDTMPAAKGKAKAKKRGFKK